MIISLLIILVGLGISAFVFVKNNKDSIVKALPKPIIILLGVFLVAFLQPIRNERIDAGSVGIKMNMTGAAQGVSNYEYTAGWCFYSWYSQRVFEFPIYIQHVEYESQETSTKGGLPAIIKPTFNYQVIPNKVGDMFVNLRTPLKQIEGEWMKSA